MTLEDLTSEQLDKLHRRLGAALREVRLIRDRMRALHWTHDDGVYQSVHKAYQELEYAAVEITRYRRHCDAEDAWREVRGG